MKVSPISNHKAEKTGKRIGTVAGFVGYNANVAIKEGKDVFKSSMEQVAQKGLNPKIGVAIKAGSIAIVAAGVAIAGRIIGGLVGKLIDNHKAKKEEAMNLQFLEGEEAEAVAKQVIDSLAGAKAQGAARTLYSASETAPRQCVARH